MVCGTYYLLGTLAILFLFEIPIWHFVVFNVSNALYCFQSDSIICILFSCCFVTDCDNKNIQMSGISRCLLADSNTSSCIVLFVQYILQLSTQKQTGFLSPILVTTKKLMGSISLKFIPQFHDPKTYRFVPPSIRPKTYMDIVSPNLKMPNVHLRICTLRHLTHIYKGSVSLSYVTQKYSCDNSFT